MLTPSVYLARSVARGHPVQEDIARQILDLTKWLDFHGYGPIPGIKGAEFDVQTPGIVGSRIRVTNLDGSSHVEEIVERQPDHRISVGNEGVLASIRRRDQAAAT
jgi:hypothetical protein